MINRVPRGEIGIKIQSSAIRYDSIMYKILKLLLLRDRKSADDVKYSTHETKTVL